MTLRVVCPEAVVSDGMRDGLNMLEFETPAPLTDKAMDALALHSLTYELFACEGELLRPLRGRAEAYLGHDLPAILKYKGKTNEQFTHLVMNLALYSAEFDAEKAGRIRYADPMCSRGTSLFLAVNRGWDADGIDLSGADLKELNVFFKRYLEYHRFKHRIEKKSCTIKNAKPAPMTQYVFADTPDRFRAGESVQMRVAETDCGRLAACFGKNRYHILTADLPYGVQHGAGGETFEALLARVLPLWRDALVPGGAMALSFNTNTLKTQTLRALMEQSGLRVQSGGLYDGLSHWVEQAVTRDVTVAIRPISR